LHHTISRRSRPSSAIYKVLAKRLKGLDVDIRLGATVASIEDDRPRPVRLVLSTGETLICDALVGADGIRSEMRTHLFGPIEPTYTGFGVWRSTHSKSAAIDTKIMMMGVGLRLGIMPISSGEVYVFATSREPDKPFYPRGRWHDLMRQKFAAFKGPAEALLDELQTPDRVVYTSVEEVHLPLPWNNNRVVVIGDAAHSSSPFMGQGGAMALEDAVVLADMLADATDVGDCLHAFGGRRFERCKFVQDASRRVGEAGAIEDKDAVSIRDEQLRTHGQQQVEDFYARMAVPV
jgi:2-polyprenyl-6-methoxyphenol hydroxylase-like FAD-dependent oxidoreductase